MEEELAQRRRISVTYCNKLLNEVKRDQEDVGEFFGGELYRTYLTAIDQVEEKIKKIRTKIRNL
ncbi:MAG: hypothetical protein E7450_06770 [Ruminococcaceae bacterium]|nr:hypothetical protein [Oscillospiraceae bacterium]